MSDPCPGVRLSAETVVEIQSRVQREARAGVLAHVTGVDVKHKPTIGGVTIVHHSAFIGQYDASIAGRGAAVEK